MGDGIVRSSQSCVDQIQTIVTPGKTSTADDGTVTTAPATTQTVVSAKAVPLGTFEKLNDAALPRVCYDASKFRTWIQDFDYGGNYGVAEIKAQIDAAKALGIESYMVWAPSNVYTKAAYVAQR